MAAQSADEAKVDATTASIRSNMILGTCSRRNKLKNFGIILADYDVDDVADRELAITESRSDSNMINKLISEALTARRQASAQVAAIVATLSGRST